LLRKQWLEPAGISRKEFFTVFILLFNSFTWFYMTILTVDSIIKDTNMALTIWTIYYMAIVSSSLVGSILANKIKRLNILYFWMALGTVTSLSPILTKDIFILYTSIPSLLLGVSVGLGMPSSLSYFADSTLVENRGRVSGIIFLVTNLGAFPLAVPFMIFDLTLSSLTLAVWRALGLILFLFFRPKDKHEDKPEKRRQVSYARIFHNKSFILYLIPWTMFTFIDRLGRGLFGRGLEEAVIGSISALIGGFLADNMGRKRVVVYGFILLGISYGVIGIAPNMLLSRYLYLVMDGFAAGTLWVTCILILWGDLSQPGMREKYYVIGNIPFFLTSLVPIFLSPYITLIPLSAAFSIASFFLFLAVLPLMYAPETLPERKIRLRQLRSYVEAAKKVREKYLKKNARG
jgi:MFS family permease